ncbi:NAD(P)-dependent oxidoreductase [archaeon]|nr:MAG: NAD(P)-dependent oxidoreductase [archaeon]
MCCLRPSSTASSTKVGIGGTSTHILQELGLVTCILHFLYVGYGQRVSERDHRPGGFSLELGYKDVSLVSQAARDAQVPMPFLSTLLDRYTSALAKGRGGMDWSGIGLGVAEEAGIDVKGDVARNEQNVKEKKTY